MFFRRKRNQPKLTREQSLASQIVRSPEVSERETKSGQLELTLRATPARWTRFLGRSADVPVVLRFELDELGRDVWKRCETRITVEQLIRGFADDHGLNLRESEVSVTSFLRVLMKRGLIGVGIPKKQ